MCGKIVLRTETFRRNRGAMAIPLKKIHGATNEPYKRRGEIEKCIVQLEELSTIELFQALTNNEKPVPMEVLLYFLRNKKWEIKGLESLFKFFFAKIESSLKKSISGEQYEKAQFIREEISGRMIEMIANDHMEESSALDYFEVNFNAAFRFLRIDVLRRMGPENEKDPLSDTISLDDDTDSKLEVKEFALRELYSSNLEDESFRFKVNEAINQLPDIERRIVGLWIQGMQTDSKDPEKSTISKTLGCTDRTVRNRLKSAFAKLRELLKSLEAEL